MYPCRKIDDSCILFADNLYDDKVIYLVIKDLLCTYSSLNYIDNIGGGGG